MNKFSTKLLSAKFLAVALMGAAFGLSDASAQTIIYQDSFTRSGGLNGSSPEIASGTFGGTGGATWGANAAWTLDGSTASTTNATNANAYLPFTPVLGETYTLSMNLTSASGSWVAMGFMIQATNPGTIDGSNGFQQVPPLPVFWDLLQTDGGIQAFGGGGTADPKFALGAGTGTQGGLYSISLQKTSEDGDYTYSFSGPGITTTAYTKNIGTNVINGVGVGIPGGSNSSVIDNFTLEVAAVPEPATVLTLALGALLLLVFRTRSKRQALP